MSLEAAIVSANYFAEHDKSQLIIKDNLKDHLHKQGFITLPDTTIDRIWKRLPKEQRSKGGRPKGAKDTH